MKSILQLLNFWGRSVFFLEYVPNYKNCWLSFYRFSNTPYWRPFAIRLGSLPSGLSRGRCWFAIQPFAIIPVSHSDLVAFSDGLTSFKCQLIQRRSPSYHGERNFEETVCSYFLYHIYYVLIFIYLRRSIYTTKYLSIHAILVICRILPELRGLNTKYFVNLSMGKHMLFWRNH